MPTNLCHTDTFWKNHGKLNSGGNIEKRLHIGEWDLHLERGRKMVENWKTDLLIVQQVNGMTKAWTEYHC